MKNKSDKMDNLDSSFSGNNETYKRGEHPNSKSNLKPFEKGESGNPDGRPSKYSKLKKKLIEIGKMQHQDFLGDHIGIKKDIVLQVIWDRAIEGDLRYIQFLASLDCLE